MKAEDVAAARINLTVRHKKTGKVYCTILNSEGFSWMQVRNGKLVVNARLYRNGRPYCPIRLIDPENYAEDVLPQPPSAAPLRGRILDHVLGGAPSGHLRTSSVSG